MNVTSEPFPHVITDTLFDHSTLRDVRKELEDALEHARPWWTRFENEHERKFQGDRKLWGEASSDFYAELAGEDFTTFVADLFDMPPLVMDAIGGGYHAVPPGGYLGIHHDFNRNTMNYYRRINLMIYLNDDWDDTGGWLQLGDEEVLVPPVFGRAVLFETSDHSWHGHPDPAQRWRYSIAAYFFSQEPPASYTHDHSTVWRNA